MTDQPKFSCFECVHFYITFDPRHPYGCSAMGFKSPRLPQHDVRATSGEDCMSFSPKKPRVRVRKLP